MATDGARPRSIFALAERDINVPASLPTRSSIQDKSNTNASGRAPSLGSPSKTAAVQRHLKSSSGAKVPVAPTNAVTFSEDEHAGLRHASGHDDDRPPGATQQLTLLGSYTHTLIIGRSKPSGKPHVSSAASSVSVDPSATMSQTDALVRAEVEALHRQSPGAKYGLKMGATGKAESAALATKYMRVCLPNDARHVSRVHALIHYSPFPAAPQVASTERVSPQKIPTAMLGTFMLRIIGQNGLLVDGERLRADTVVPLVPGRTRLGFFSGVEAIFNVDTAAMPPHIRSRALEVQSRLTPRASAELSNGSPKKKTVKTALATLPSLTSSRLAYAEAGEATQRSGQSKDKHSRPSHRSAHGAPTPPPTSSPTRDLDDDSQEAVSQALRPLKTHAPAGDVDSLSPPPSSSPVPMRNQSRKRKLHEVVLPSEEDSSAGSQDEEEGEHRQGPSRVVSRSGAPPSSPTAAANRRRTAGQTGMSRSDRPSAEMHHKDDEESDSGLSSGSSLSDSAASSPDLRRANKTKVSSASKPRASESQKKMPPPPVPIRSSMRQNTAGAPSLSRPIPTAVATPAADPIAVARGLYLQSAARRAVAALAPSYDLEGLLAFSIVFHRTATMSASEAVRSVLSGTPGLMSGVVGPQSPTSNAHSGSAGEGQKLKEGDTLASFSFEHAAAHAPMIQGRKLTITPAQWTTALTKGWREQLELVLRSSSAGSSPAPIDGNTTSTPHARGPFGAIQRAGKDSAGNPLEPWYYYMAEADPDRERARNLAGYVKPIRGALKVHKPIYWKKSAYGHRHLADGVVEGGEAVAEGEAGTAGVGGTSFLSRSVANEVWGSNTEWGPGPGPGPAPSADVSSANVTTGADKAGAHDVPNTNNDDGDELSESLVASSGSGYAGALPARDRPVDGGAKVTSTRGAAAMALSVVDVPDGVTQRLVDRVWGETQEEDEEEEATWDKVGDMDWRE